MGCSTIPKKEDIYNLLARTKPHVAIFSETRQRPDSPIMLPDDHIRNRSDKLTAYYTAHATPRAENNQSTGVTILVRKGIPATHVLGGSAVIPGRSCAVDITLPDVVGRPRQIRIIGIYAPTEPNSPVTRET